MFNFLQHACIYQVVLMIEQLFSSLFSSLFQNGKRRIILIYTTSLQKQAKEAEDTAFLGSCTLFKLAKFGLILVVSIWLSILSCIDISYFFHTLFFVSHIFSTNPVPLHFFIIVCSSGGLQVGWTIQRIIVRWFASSPMCIII